MILKQILSKVFWEEGADEIVILKDIPFTALCEHHMLPFSGTVDIGYLPSCELERTESIMGTPILKENNKYRVVGLSKTCTPSRLLLRKRLTMQETNDEGNSERNLPLISKHEERW